MKRSLFALAICLVLLIGGVATAVGTFYQRSVQVRGWADPTRDANLPDRLPLAGVNVELTLYDAATLDRELGRIEAAGFTWVRQTFMWSDIEPTDGQFDFSKYDALVAAVRNHKALKIVAVMDGSPAWARRADASDRLFAPPASMAAFGAFAGKFAMHYADAIDYYQVWDEPNLNTHWGGLDPRPADYAAMLKSAYSAIHGNDPVATVITAGFAPTVEEGPRNVSDVLYLQALYEAGAANSFDAVAGKPYGFNSSPMDRTVSTDVLNFSHIILLREEMVRHNDAQKALWGSHFGWNHLPADWSGPPSIWGQVDAATQKQYTRDAYTRAEQEWPWMGGLILAYWQPAAPADDPIQGFAVANVAADWFDNGAFFARPALTNGRFPAADPRIVYQGDWRFGPLGADPQNLAKAVLPEDGSAHQFKLTFEGSALAFQIRRADYVAFMYIHIDGAPANALPRLSNGDAYIIFKTPDLAAHTDLIVAANNLGPGTHTAEVRTYVGGELGRWPFASVAVGTSPDTRRYDLLIAAGIAAAVLGLLGAIVFARRIVRRRETAQAAAPLIAYVRQMVDVIGGLIVSGLALMGMLFTFGNILPKLFQQQTPTLAVALITAGLAYFSPAFIVTMALFAVLWLIIYNRPMVGLALIIFWAPFFLTPYALYLWSFPMVETCLALTLTAVIARSIIGRATRKTAADSGDSTGLSWQLADKAILAFTLVATITILWSEQRNPAIREWRTMVIEPVIFYLLIRVLRPSPRDIVRLIDVLLLAGLVVAGIGLVEYALHRGVDVQGSLRLESVYTSPNNAALFFGRCLPFGLAMFLISPNGLRRTLAGLITLVILIAALLTQSAGAILLGIPAGFAVVLLLWNRRIGLMAIGVMAVLLIALIPLSRYVPRLQGLFDLSRSSSFVRIQVWTSTVSLLREHPLTGAGLDQFLYLYRSRYILPDAYREPDLSHPHNFILDYWVSLGILGLGVLIALQLAFWRSAIRLWRGWRSEDRLMLAIVIGAMGSMADFLAHGVVDNSYFVIDLAFIFCFTLAVITRLNEAKAAQPALETANVTPEILATEGAR